MMRVRFAPSPTGNLHVGGLRTALFNYIITKKSGGKFILRIEDTDILRSKPEYEESIINSLKWIGINWDEFYRQSDRTDRYDLYFDRLISENKAYYQLFLILLYMIHSEQFFSNFSIFQIFTITTI